MCKVVTPPRLFRGLFAGGKSCTRAGFSLTEVLVVLAIISLITAISGAALVGAVGANQVSTAGSRVAELISLARENAIVDRRPTAVVLLVPGSAIADRVFTVLEYQPPTPPALTGSWSQISKWEVLPAGVVVDNGVDSLGNPATTFLPPYSPTAAALSSVSYQGQTYNPNIAQGYAYFIFREDGGIMRDASGNPPSPVKLRLDGGVVTSTGSIQFTGPKNAINGRADYFDIIVNDETGCTKIARP